MAANKKNSREIMSGWTSWNDIQKDFGMLNASYEETTGLDKPAEDPIQEVDLDLIKKCMHSASAGSINESLCFKTADVESAFDLKKSRKKFEDYQKQKQLEKTSLNNNTHRNVIIARFAEGPVQLRIDDLTEFPRLG